jgi:hypothetical protein
MDRARQWAGFALWFVGWMTFFKVDHLPFIGRFIRKGRMIGCISHNKVLTLMCTDELRLYEDRQPKYIPIGHNAADADAERKKLEKSPSKTAAKKTAEGAGGTFVDKEDRQTLARTAAAYALAVRLTVPTITACRGLPPPSPQCGHYSHLARATRHAWRTRKTNISTYRSITGTMFPLT